MNIMAAWPVLQFDTIRVIVVGAGVGVKTLRILPGEPPDAEALTLSASLGTVLRKITAILVKLTVKQTAPFSDDGTVLLPC